MFKQRKTIAGGGLIVRAALEELAKLCYSQHKSITQFELTRPILNKV